MTQERSMLLLVHHHNNRSNSMLSRKDSGDPVLRQEVAFPQPSDPTVLSRIITINSNNINYNNNKKILRSVDQVTSLPPLKRHHHRLGEEVRMSIQHTQSQIHCKVSTPPVNLLQHNLPPLPRTCILPRTPTRT
eukprot:PhF_6_TR14895/c1_g1_i2/m.23232